MIYILQYYLISWSIYFLWALMSSRWIISCRGTFLQSQLLPCGRGFLWSCERGGGGFHSTGRNQLWFIPRTSLSFLPEPTFHTLPTHQTWVREPSFFFSFFILSHKNKFTWMQKSCVGVQCTACCCCTSTRRIVSTLCFVLVPLFLFFYYF